jgi:hypothetical protein
MFAMGTRSLLGGEGLGNTFFFNSIGQPIVNRIVVQTEISLHPSNACKKGVRAMKYQW